MIAIKIFKQVQNGLTQLGFKIINVLPYTSISDLTESVKANNPEIRLSLKLYVENSHFSIEGMGNSV